MQEFYLDHTIQQSVLAMAQIGEKVWVGTSTGMVWLCNVEGGPSDMLSLAETSIEGRTGGGAIKCLLQVRICFDQLGVVIAFQFLQLGTRS